VGAIETAGRIAPAAPFPCAIAARPQLIPQGADVIADPSPPGLWCFRQQAWFLAVGQHPPSEIEASATGARDARDSNNAKHTADTPRIQ
jgi:hypothetical protein